MRPSQIVTLSAALFMSACTHIDVIGGAHAPKTEAPTVQTRKVNYLAWMFFEMQRAAPVTDVCFPLSSDGFSIGMDSIDWLLSVGTAGLYVQQTVTYRCSPAPETKKVSKNRW